MKKYYGIFHYNDIPYVIRFKIKGSLAFDEQQRCFIDKKWYVRSSREIICTAAFDTHPLNMRNFSCCCWLISHDEFVQHRANGVKRWKPKREIIDWD